MHTLRPLTLALLLALGACSTPVQGTEPPPGGWANTAPTEVVQVIDRGEHQLLLVQQGSLRTWIQVPNHRAKVGQYVLLGQGAARQDVDIPELGERVDAVVDIDHVQVVDEAAAKAAVAAVAPADAVPIGTLFAELDARDGTPIVVHGTVAKATSAAGSVWVHVQDGTGDEAAKTHDLMVQTSATVTRGQRVTFRGVLRKDADIGFGYHFDAMLENAELVK